MDTVVGTAMGDGGPSARTSCVACRCSFARAVTSASVLLAGAMGTACVTSIEPGLTVPPMSSCSSVVSPSVFSGMYRRDQKAADRYISISSGMFGHLDAAPLPSRAWRWYQPSALAMAMSTRGPTHSSPVRLSVATARTPQLSPSSRVPTQRQRIGVHSGEAFTTPIRNFEVQLGFP